jgi:hypothetical protein
MEEIVSLEELRSLSPVQAIQTMLDRELKPPDQKAVIDAIRRDVRIDLPEKAIIDIVDGAIGGEITARECLDLLVATSCRQRAPALALVYAPPND